MAFGLNLYPITYIARYNPTTKAWDEEWFQADSVTYDELMKMSEMLSGVVPYLVTSYPVFDMTPVTVNLYVLRFTLGLAFAPNLMSILGVVLAIYLFRKY